MTITEYFATPYKIMTDEQSAAYPFFGIIALRQTEEIIKNKYGMREIFFSETDTALQTRVESAVKALFDTQTYSWTTLKNSISLAYSPFERTAIVENDTETNSGTDGKTNTRTGSTSITVTPNTKSATSKRTYNNDTMTDIEEVANSGTEVNAGSNSGTDTYTDTYGHVITKVHTITGKENVDYEAVIKAEREIAEFNFIATIANTIVNTICLLTYNFDNSYAPYNPIT